MSSYVDSNPNMDRLLIGSEVGIWSLDPELGVLHIVGVGQVQADGTITTISGGIRAADWHAVLLPAGRCKLSDVSTQPIMSSSKFIRLNGEFKKKVSQYQHCIIGLFFAGAGAEYSVIVQEQNGSSI